MKKHFCPDWDFMAIDETCPEFECCNCKFDPPPPPPEQTAIKNG